MAAPPRLPLLFACVLAVAPAFAAPIRPERPAEPHSGVDQVVYHGRDLAGTPYAGSIVALGPADEKYPWHCSGVVIAPDLVLTAGHCVRKGYPRPDAADIPVQFVMFFDADGKPAEKRAVTAHPALHPEWAQPGFGELRNDLAIVRFDGGLPAGHEAALLLEDASVLKGGHLWWWGGSISAAGAGLNDKQQLAEARAAALRIESVDATTFKVSDPDRKTGMCEGDSGGPAFVDTKDGPRLAGVLTTGNGFLCLEPERSVFTLVPAFLGWIRQAMAAARSSPDAPPSGAALDAAKERIDKLLSRGSGAPL